MENKIAIKVCNLSKKYDDIEVVSNLNLEILKGEVFGFLGPNGAGKSTSINMICGLLKPSGGDVFIFDEKISNNEDFKTKVGLCTQENIYWAKLSLLEQLQFMGEMYDIKPANARKKAIELLDKMGLTEKQHQFAETLSGGMKRRLNICLALIHDPEIVVFDEPEAGLDPQSRILVRDFIKSIARQKTVIITTHNMDEADRLADRIAIIDKGKLLQLDTPDNLKQSIGSGDVLEIKIAAKDDFKIPRILSLIKAVSHHAHSSDGIISIKSKKLLESIPEISKILKHENIQILEMNMKSNSLEDVFISLTGRRLRD